MKKVFRFFYLAVLAASVATFIACGDDKNDNENGNGNEGGTEVDLPTTLDETFDNGIPEGWTNIDADGDGYAWQDWIMDQYGSEMSLDGQVASCSYINPSTVLTPDNYLVTPKLHIEDGAVLSYEVAPIDPSYYQDHYAVLVGTVENGAFKAEGTLLEEDCSPSAVTRVINLSEYKGQNLCIAFRHFNCTDQYTMTLDNVTVGTGTKAYTAPQTHNLKNANKVK